MANGKASTKKESEDGAKGATGAGAAPVVVAVPLQGGGEGGAGGSGASAGSFGVGGDKVVMKPIVFKGSAKEDPKKNKEEQVFIVEFLEERPEILVTGIFVRTANVRARLGVAGFAKTERVDQGMVALVETFLRKVRRYPLFDGLSDEEVKTKGFVEKFVLEYDDDEVQAYAPGSSESPAKGGAGGAAVIGEGSPKKRVRVRNLPASEAIDEWVIKTGAGNRVVTVGDVG